MSLEERSRRAIAARELSVDVQRLRVASWVGLAVWISFAVFDALQVRYLGVPHLRELLTLRGAMALYLFALAIYARLETRMTEAKLEVAFVSVLSGMTTCMALASLYTGGFESLYGAGILISTSAVVLVPRPFPVMFLRMLVILLPYPIVLFGSTLFVPEMRAALSDPRAMAFTLQFHFVGTATGIFLGLVSHALWSMRRELYAAQSVGRYRLKKKLGVGGMGEVWSASHHGLRRDVAVKILRAHVGEDDTAAKRFEREIRAMASLDHPNTVRLYDFGVAEDGRPYYAMELLEGRTMRALVRAEGALPPARAVHLVTQTAHALAEAHAAGIVHRDVKAENLFVTSIGDQGDFVKVLDFGIAAVSDTHVDLTRTGSVAGTPATMSPEMILGEPTTPASDVYALGAVFYYLLTGELPFGEEPGATLIAHVQQAPVPPSIRRPEIPPDVEAIVLRCLAKDPRARYPSARELAFELEACSMAGRWRASERPPPPPTPPDPDPVTGGSFDEAETRVTGRAARASSEVVGEDALDVPLRDGRDRE